MKTLTYTLSLLAVGLSAATAAADDWPTWGHDPARNMHSAANGLVDQFDPGQFKSGTEEIDPETTKNVKWVAKLGSQAYGNPTVANGRVFVGTNNETPRDPKHQGDRGVVYCLDEETGEFQWQLVVPKLGAGKVSDWEYLGICSSPSVEGDRVYLVTSRCEVMCIDFNGLKDGNDGPFKNEGQYMAPSDEPAMEVSSTDADIIWKYDMRAELGVFPHNITSSSVLVVGDRVYATTSNGQDWSHHNIPSPFAPALVVLDKNTGELVGEEASGISQRLMHSNWSSPAYGEVDDQGIVIFGAGDGFCYGFDPKPVKGEQGYMILPELWRYDCVPKEYKVDEDGEKIQYPSADGPSEVIATPVFYKDRVYVAIGQDPEHGEGVGSLSCIDATQEGDISGNGAVWTFNDIHRTISTVSIDPQTDLLYVADYSGFVYCLDADTGELQWKHDMLAHIWGSTLVSDGKVYLGDEDGDFVILSATKEKKVISETNFGVPVYSTPIEANGVVYVATQTHLYALDNEGQQQAARK